MIVALVAETAGVVAPIGWLSAPTILIDVALSGYDIIWAAAGLPHSVYPTLFTELLRVTGAQPIFVGE
ncbi:MAG: hypothetical protein D4S00_06025 [Streptomycetaceae bacterium]|nr:MAG: hypothetical protein D4S00_06025 [Streptomycetaceae bacterium]